MIPLLYEGAPGIGKTATLYEDYDYLEPLLLSSKSEEDISGLIYREGKYERRTTPEFIERVQKNHKAGMKTAIFLDEIDKSRREVADTLLTFITHPHQFGVPEGVDIIAAANPPEWGGGDGLSTPMLSRFCIINFEIDIKRLFAYFRKKHFELGEHFFNEFENSIENEVIPLVEKTGEGLQTRLTCPRTYDMAFQILKENSPIKDKKIKGVLNANAATHILALASLINPIKEIKKENIDLNLFVKKILIKKNKPNIVTPIDFRI